MGLEEPWGEDPWRLSWEAEAGAAVVYEVEGEVAGVDLPPPALAPSGRELEWVDTGRVSL